MPDNLKTYWGWQTWLKYKHLFSQTDYLLWSEPSPWVDEVEIILLANKKMVSALVEQHVNDFRQALQKETVSSEGLLKEAKTKPLLREVLQKHEGLIGTLLGYGRENSWLFHKRDLGESVSLGYPWDSTEELKDVRHSLAWFGLVYRPSQDLSTELSCPHFVADIHSEETRQLKESYLSMRKKILKIYQDKNFLETTLNFLIN